MSSPRATAERPDPRQVRSRELILDAAVDEFTEHGYLAATMDGIALHAGVAKRTVYNLFAAKEELFRAVVRRATAIAARFVDDRVEGEVGAGPVEDELRAFAVAHARAVVHPRVIATRRLLIGEAHRFPELAADYFDRVPGAVLSAIADRLSRYDRAGLLVVPDADTAAAHFAYLVLGEALDRALFLPVVPDSERIDAAARSGADAFLRAYRAQ